MLAYIFFEKNIFVYNKMDLLLNNKVEDRLSIALTLPHELILDICSQNTELNNTICINEEYWKLRYIKNYGTPTILPVNWKELYLNSNVLMSFGSNKFGQLGVGDMVFRSIPTKIPNINPIYTTCGSYHNLIIDTNNDVWCFGLNNKGQLGVGDTINKNVPTKIPNLKAIHASAGKYHSLIVDMNNNVWCFGSNNRGQLGLGNTVGIKNIPTQIPNIKALYVACGEESSYIIDMDNILWKFGTSIKTKDSDIRYISKYTPTKVFNIKVKYASSKLYHVLVIDTNNNVWSFGNNQYGQLGIGNNISQGQPQQIPNIKAKHIAAGSLHSLILDNNGNIWSFGRNTHGQLGLGLNPDQDIYKPTMIPNIKAKYISAGTIHSIIIDDNDKIWSFGLNVHGSLGLGDTQDRNIPVKIPEGTFKYVSSGSTHNLVIFEGGFLSFDQIQSLFINVEVTQFLFEPQMQIMYKLQQGIYVATFVLENNKKKYGYVRYDSVNNKIQHP